MKRLLAIALGILTAIGGVVDIGDLVANALVGARFVMSLAWVVVVGVVGICLFAEMTGRVTAPPSSAARVRNVTSNLEIQRGDHPQRRVDPGPGLRAYSWPFKPRSRHSTRTDTRWRTRGRRLAFDPPPLLERRGGRAS